MLHCGVSASPSSSTSLETVSEESPFSTSPVLGFQACVSSCPSSLFMAILLRCSVSSGYHFPLETFWRAFYLFQCISCFLFCLTDPQHTTAELSLKTFIEDSERSKFTSDVSFRGNQTFWVGELRGSVGIEGCGWVIESRINASEIRFLEGSVVASIDA